MASREAKKVLFVITKSNWGGAQAYVFELAQALKARGADAVVALGGTGLPGADSGLLAERLKEAGIRIVFLKSMTRDVSLARDIASFHELRAVIRSERPDIVHLNSSKAGGIGALAARLEHDKRIIFTAHGWAYQEPRPFLKRIAIWLSSWLTVCFSHAIIVVSDRDYRHAPIFFSKKKLRMIHNGLSAFQLASRDEARTELVHDESLQNNFCILMQAELHANKGIDIAVRALKKISDSHPDIRLIVMGEGEERIQVEKLIAELGLSSHVVLRGFVANSRRFLSAGDVFLMPSRKEGLPLALLEAGLARLPVVASDVGGIPEIIENEKTGLLVQANDVDGFAHALQTLIENPEERVAYGNALHDFIAQNFSQEEMLQKTLDLYGLN